jgi:transcription elongation factor Elf1
MQSFTVVNGDDAWHITCGICGAEFDADADELEREICDHLEEKHEPAGGWV